MALQGFDSAYYLGAKLAALQAASATATSWAGKTTTFLETVLTASGFTAESHYMQYGYAEGLAPNAYFNAGEYKLAKATAMFNAGTGGYLTVGAAQDAFDAAWTGDAYQHYLQYGSKEGINPSNAFDESSYLTAKLAALQAASATATEWAGKTTTDVLNAFTAAGLTVLGHFMTYGTAESLSVTAVPTAEQVTSGGISTTPGSSYTLTAAPDTFTGTANNDTFNAGTADTFSTLDVLDGGQGTDTLTALISGTTLPTSSTVTNIENVTMVTTGAGFTGDFSGYTGLTALTLTSSDTTAANDLTLTAATTTAVTTTFSGGDDVTITGGKTVNATFTGADDALITGVKDSVTVAAGNAAGDITSINTNSTMTSVTVTDGGIIAIGDGLTALTDVTFTDDSVTDVLTTVSVASNAGALTVNSDALTSLTLASTNQNATVTAAAGTRALALSLNAVTGGVITDSTATSVAITATGAASTPATVAIAAATSVSIAADEALTIATFTITAATALSITGDSLVNIGGTALTDTALTAIDASAATGGVTVGQALNTTTSYAGGSGVDTISVAASGTKAITTGGGADVVTMATALGTGGSVDAGDGTDVLVLSAANAVTNTASATFEGMISNFEVLMIGATAGGTAVNLANLDDISSVIMTGAIGHATTFTGMVSGGTLEYRAAGTSTTGVTIVDASLGGHNSDVLNIKLNGVTTGGATDYTTLTAAAVETININSTRSNTAVAADINEMDLVASGLVTLTITGDTICDLDNAALTAATIQTITGAANTAGIRVSVAGASQGVSLIGSTAGANTLIGGNGGDVITGGAGAATLTGNAGDDTITGGAGVDTIDAGAGTDTIVAGAGVDDITGGAGADTITSGAGADVLRLTGGDTVTDFTQGTGGDVIDVSDAGNSSLGALVAQVAENTTAAVTHADNGILFLSCATAASYDSKAEIATLFGAAAEFEAVAAAEEFTLFISAADTGHTYIYDLTEVSGNTSLADGADTITLVATLSGIDATEAAAIVAANFQA